MKKWFAASFANGTLLAKFMNKWNLKSGEVMILTSYENFGASGISFLYYAKKDLSK